MADNIIVGSGPGMESQVKVFSSTLPSESGQAPDVFSTFTPYPGSQFGVSLATGLVEAGSGRESIVTSPGPAMRRWSSPSDGTCSPRRPARRPMARRHKVIRASPPTR
jgi:hypothetical protein